MFDSNFELNEREIADRRNRMEAEFEAEFDRLKATQRRVSQSCGMPPKPTHGTGRRTLGTRVHQKASQKPVFRISKTRMGVEVYETRPQVPGPLYRPNLAVRKAV
jgi:hypothetical protein